MRPYDPDMDGPDDDVRELDDDEEVAGPRFDDAVGDMAEKLADARLIIAALLYPGDTEVEAWRQRAREFIGVKRIELEPRIVDAVWSGARKFALLAATGPAVAPRFHPPAAAVEGDTVELHFDGMMRVVKVTKTQTISMQTSNGVAWSQCGKHSAAFPLYSTEEDELTKMDGWPNDGARFAHYCPEGKRFDGHLIWWEAING